MCLYIHSLQIKLCSDFYCKISTNNLLFSICFRVFNPTRLYFEFWCSKKIVRESFYYDNFKRFTWIYLWHIIPVISLPILETIFPIYFNLFIFRFVYIIVGTLCLYVIYKIINKKFNIF